MVKIRILAGILAVGGLLWGLFCLIFIVAGDTAKALMLFGPGYVVTVGYIVRCCSLPPLAWRRAIWGLSGLVQGAWLLWALSGVVQSGFRGFAFEFITLAWWLFAFAVSVYGLVAERDRQIA